MLPVTATIERLQDNQVYLLFADGQTLHLPETAFHGTPSVGSTVRIMSAVSGTEASSEGALAHALLNELLGSST